MKIGEFEIKPFAIYLPDAEEWIERAHIAKKYFAEQGVTDIHWTPGIHAFKWGLQGRYIYLHDGRPEQQFYIGDAKVGGCLSVYIEWCIADALPYQYYMFLEDDCVFVDGWKEKLNQAMIDMGEDWDVLFASHCCASDKQPILVKGDLYEFPYRGKDKADWYPQALHFYLLNKRCIPYLIATNRNVASPMDVAMIDNSFKNLRVFGIIPRLAEQRGTDLPL